MAAHAFVAVSLLVAAGCAGVDGSAEPRSAVVEHVVDGDTLVIRGGERVRLVQIDAPEASGECHAAEATRELERLAPPGTRIVLEADPALDGVDLFRRLLRYVRAGGRNVNVELVRRGAATPYFFDGDRGRHASTLLSALATARAERRGMWGRCNVFWRPTAPVDTRTH